VGRFCRVRPGGHLSSRWPVLPAVAVPMRPGAAPRSRPLSDRLQRSRDAPRSLARCAAVAIRVVPRQLLVVFSASVKTLLISTKATCLTPKSTSRASFSLAGFQTLIGRFWVTPEDGKGKEREESRARLPMITRYHAFGMRLRNNSTSIITANIEIKVANSIPANRVETFCLCRRRAAAVTALACEK
jgi:hypothetical protein